jgi:hypothetical protein
VKKPEAQTIVLVLGLGAAFTGCTLILGGDKTYVDLDTTSSASSEAATGAGGAATTASASSAGGMTTGQGSSTGTCGAGQGGCGGAGTSTASVTSTATATSTAAATSSASSSASTGSGGPLLCELSSGPFTDSFTGSPLNPARWGIYADTLGSAIAQTGNQVAIFNSGTPGAFVGFYSQERFPLQGCSLSLKVLDAPKITGVNVFFLLSSIVNDADQVTFVQSGNYLNMEVKLTSGSKAAAQIPFVKGKHVYWRFRESSQTGKLYWETSTDGAVWDEQYSYTTANLGFPVDQMQVNIGVTSDGAPGGTTHVDSFNLIP